MIFMYKHKRNLTPHVFKQYFREINHKYPTRYSRDKYRETIRTTYQQHNIANRGPAIWNQLHQNTITGNNSFPVSKRTLKRYLLDQ